MQRGSKGFFLAPVTAHKDLFLGYRFLRGVDLGRDKERVDSHWVREHFGKNTFAGRRLEEVALFFLYCGEEGGWIESELGFQQKTTFFSPEAMKTPVIFRRKSFFPRTLTKVA